MEESLINILGADEIDTLFSSEETPENETQEEGIQKNSEEPDENNETTATEAKGSLFEEDVQQPESEGCSF